VGFREVSVVEVREVLRGWLEGHGLRKVAERAGVTTQQPTEAQGARSLLPRMTPSRGTTA